MSARVIKEVVANHFELKVKSDLEGPRRHRRVADPRAIAMYLCRGMLNESFAGIGKSFGGRDHSTVFVAVNKVKERLGKDEMFRNLISLLRQAIHKELSDGVIKPTDKGPVRDQV